MENENMNVGTMGLAVASDNNVATYEVVEREKKLYNSGYDDGYKVGRKNGKKVATVAVTGTAIAVGAVTGLITAHFVKKETSKTAKLEAENAELKKRLGINATPDNCEVVKLTDGRIAYVQKDQKTSETDEK